MTLQLEYNGNVSYRRSEMFAIEEVIHPHSSTSDGHGGGEKGVIRREKKRRLPSWLFSFPSNPARHYGGVRED